MAKILLSDRLTLKKLVEIHFTPRRGIDRDYSCGFVEKYKKLEKYAGIALVKRRVLWFHDCGRFFQ